MKKNRALLWLALLAAFALFVASCGDDDSDTTTTPDDGDDMADDDGDDMADDDGDDMADDDGDDMADDDGDDMADDDGDDMADDDGDDMADDDGDDMAEDMLPGEGISVTMARADWSTGYYQAQIFKQLLEELGYDVSEPSEKELGPSLAYLAMAEGDVDFWANSWYPGHDSWWAPELPDGSFVGDHLEKVGAVFLGGGLQGFLITKTTADEYGITHIDQINDDPEIRALFDSDGDGVAEIYGCQESWTCDDIITNQIAFNGWDNITQTIAGYEAMFAEATGKAEAGDPMVIYTWTPSGYITELRPGDNVYWIGMEETLDDSNPSGVGGGEAHDQRYWAGTTDLVELAIPAEQCPAAADAGHCPLGWVPADIQVTANSDWLAANPPAAELLRAAKLSVVEVSIVNVEQSDGNWTEAEIAQAASNWIADNRDQVDPWLAAGLAAA